MFVDANTRRLVAHCNRGGEILRKPKWRLVTREPEKCSTCHNRIFTEETNNKKMEIKVKKKRAGGKMGTAKNAGISNRWRKHQNNAHTKHIRTLHLSPYNLSGFVCFIFFLWPCWLDAASFEAILSHCIHLQIVERETESLFQKRTETPLE